VNGKLRIVLLLLVVTPPALLGWVGRRTLTREREAVRAQLEALHRSRLETVRDRVVDILEEHRLALAEAVEPLPAGPEAPRELVRSHGLIRQIFVLAPEGRLLHPPPEGPISSAERAFLERTRPIWTDPRSFHRSGVGEPPLRKGSRRSAPESAEAMPREGWRVWFWEHGLDLIARRSSVLEPMRGESNLYSIRLRGTTNNPRVLACALRGHRCIVLLHAFKELRPSAYRRELPVARRRRDLVVADPETRVDAVL